MPNYVSLLLGSLMGNSCVKSEKADNLQQAGTRTAQFGNPQGQQVSTLQAGQRMSNPNQFALYGGGYTPSHLTHRVPQSPYIQKQKSPLLPRPANTSRGATVHVITSFRVSKCCFSLFVLAHSYLLCSSSHALCVISLLDSCLLLLLFHFGQPTGLKSSYKSFNSYDLMTCC